MKRNRKQTAWALIFGSLVLCCVCVVLLHIGSSMENKTAIIYQDGVSVREIKLDAITEPIVFDVVDDKGHKNTVRAERGRICMVNADCPDKLCIHQGWIDNGAVPIVCLPNRVTIEITGGRSNIDVQTGGM